jgi:hypothetical protein
MVHIMEYLQQLATLRPHHPFQTHELQRVEDDRTLLQTATQQRLDNTLQGPLPFCHRPYLGVLPLQPLLVLLLESLLLGLLPLEVVHQVLQIDELVLLETVEDGCEFLVLESREVLVAVLDELLVV